MTTKTRTATTIILTALLTLGAAWTLKPDQETTHTTETITITDTQTITQTIHTHETHTETTTHTIDPREAETKYERVVHPPKYIQGYDFTGPIITLSATPHTNTPYTGSGVPHINIHYEDQVDEDFNDTQVLHNAYLTGVGTGFTLCTNPSITFTVTEGLHIGDGVVSYTTDPIPSNPLNLLGSGANCYARAYAMSTWFLRVCHEGDGDIAPHQQVRDEANNTVTDHYDFMDYCWVQNIDTP